MSDAASLKRDLQARIDDVCRYLLPGGKKRGHEYRCGSLAGGAGESLGVHLSGSKAGMWAEFNGEAGEMRGDVFALVESARGCSFVEALDWARDFLGHAPVEFHRPKAKSYRRPERPADARRPGADSAVASYLSRTRGLTDETIRVFQFAEGPYPERRETPEWAGRPAVVLPYKRAGELVMVKWLALGRREDGKKVITTTAGSEPCSFGWHAIPADARSVVVAEGEIDAATWWQLGYPALAPPRGTGSLDWIDAEYPEFERFETVYVAYDNDEPGRVAAAKVAARFGDRARLVGHLDSARYGKDANAWLTAGATPEQFAALIAGARDCGPDELVRPAVLRDAVYARFYPTGAESPGPVPPFDKIAGRVRFRPSELSIWTGFNHHGKSTMLKYLMLSAAYQGTPVCVAMLEEMPEVTVEHLVRQATGERTPRPEVLDAALDWLTERFVVWDHRKGSVKLERVVEVFGYARRRFGCTQFVLDNLAMLGIGEDDYNRQKDAMIALLDLTRTTGAHVHVVAHPRKGSDETEPPGKLDVRGGAVLTDLAHNVFCHWKNVKKAERLAELEAECDPGNEIPALVGAEPDAVFAVRKQRETGDTPIVKLWFHRPSLQFHQEPYQDALSFVVAPSAAEDASKDEPSGFVEWEDDGARPF